MTALVRRHAYASLLAVLLVSCSGGGREGRGHFDDSDPATGGDSGTHAHPDAGPINPGACVPRTCAEAGANCGPIADGCGGITDDCGTCDAAGETCGGGGVPNVCGGGFGNCVPRTCAELGVNCGPAGDGCGGLIDTCGTCDAPGETCGGGGAPSVCGAPEEDPDHCAALLTCEDVGAECGQIGNGCGGLLQCGDCHLPETCGGGGVPNQCGAPTCEPATCDDVPADHCGPASDGCGGLLTDCGVMCTAPQTCGGGGAPDRCGSGSCSRRDQAEACAGNRCGPVSDGCGGVIQCGGCPSGLSCGGGGTPSVCGAPACVPRTCAELNATCGQVPDGCGAILNCGSCTAGQTCGGAGVPNQCGAPTCSPQSCSAQGIGCGMAGDGCGGSLDCGSCPSGQSCGGGGVPNQCGAPAPCVPQATSCAGLGWACGIAVDNCGNTYDCAAEGLVCSGLETCRGTGPTQCVSIDDGSCPLCPAVPSCPDASPTRLTGRVITPGRDDSNTGNQVGVPNAFVYIPRRSDPAVLPAIATGIPAHGTSCDRCEEQDLGPVLASAVTDAQGRYVLQGNIPVDEEFLLVVKVGKFRRAVRMTLPPTAACRSTQVALTNTRLPRSPADSGLAIHLPRIAITTGEIDAMECVFEKMGIAHSEFANPGNNASAAGRIHLYRGGLSAPGSGARINGGTPFDGQLYSDLNRLLSYDLVVADCEGSSWDGANGFEQRARWGEHVRRYVNRGGRLFASHLSFSWLFENGNQAYAPNNASTTGLAAAASWDINLDLSGSGTGVVSIVGNRPRASARIGNFAAWMENEGVTTAPQYRFPINQPRSQATGLGTQSEEFVYLDGGNGRVQQFSFNTPYAAPAAAACGRVAYSGFHVVAGSGLWPYADAVFPDHCNGNLTDQEKVLLYMLFDLGACVGDEPTPPSCTPLTCGQAAAQCGVLGDGCGGVLNCGGCPGPNSLCVDNQCVSSCTPRTCAELSANCGLVADGCGEVLDCGDCPDGQTCGANAPNQCGYADCVPRSCEASNAECGMLADGCGDVVDCGDCPAGLICGANAPNQCGSGQCTPQTCQSVEAECGLIGDGCGGSMNCGTCPPGLTCGGGGVPNKCGGGCQALSCESLGAECGLIGDGCGGSTDCGDCPAGQVCGAGGPNKCDGGCERLSCQTVGAECGWIGTGCGDAVDCGDCPPGQICGGGGEPNKCADGPGCKPLTCESVGAECGLIGNGCGGTADCGTCPEGLVCGGDGVPNKCGGACTKLTCAGTGAQCGLISDGCGGLADCGVCEPPFVCGGFGTPNKCEGLQ